MRSANSSSRATPSCCDFFSSSCCFRISCISTKNLSLNCSDSSFASLNSAIMRRTFTFPTLSSASCTLSSDLVPHRLSSTKYAFHSPAWQLQYHPHRLKQIATSSFSCLPIKRAKKIDEIAYYKHVQNIDETSRWQACTENRWKIADDNQISVCVMK